MNHPIHIGESSGRRFALPLEIVTQSIAVLAKRGAGKSFTAAVLTEELLDADQQVVCIDPTGAAWGLKSSADGNSAGYKVVIFGGDHADLPLEETGGKVVARAVVEHRFSCVIDISLFRKGQSLRFLTDFLETLYLLNRLPVHLVCDEADYYAPQKVFGEDARTLGAMQDIVRRGRKKGIGCTLISQRPSVLNKDVLTQCEVLVAMRLVHPRDIGAIKEWVAVHGDPKVADTMISSLPSLPIGTAWIWSPGFGDIFEQVKIRHRRTFDSGATPKAGEVIRAPKRMADVDLEKLGGEIAATVANAKANDPAELKKRIHELEADLKKLPAAPTKTEIVERFVITNDQMAQIIDVGREAAKLDTSAASLLQKVTVIEQTIQKLKNELQAKRASAIFDRDRPLKTHSIEVPVPRRKLTFINRGTAPVDGDLTPALRKVLTVLAQVPDGCHNGKLALLSGYTYGGGFRNLLSELRTKGYLQGANTDTMQITEAGVDALGPYEPLPTGRALADYWLNNPRLAPAERRVLATLLANPAGMSAPDLAAACEPPYQYGGGFRNILSSLRTAGVIVGKNTGTIQASPDLFD